MQQLVADGFTAYYWSKEQSDGELDFIIQKDTNLIPMEVKAEENVRSRSLSQFIKKHPEYKGLRISMRGFQDQDWMLNIPLYAINRYLNG